MPLTDEVERLVREAQARGVQAEQQERDLYSRFADNERRVKQRCQDLDFFLLNKFGGPIFLSLGAYSAETLYDKYDPLRKRVAEALIPHTSISFNYGDRNFTHNSRRLVDSWGSGLKREGSWNSSSHGDSFDETGQTTQRIYYAATARGFAVIEHLEVRPRSYKGTDTWTELQFIGGVEQLWSVIAPKIADSMRSIK